MEPENTAKAVKSWNVDYIVMTSVDRYWLLLQHLVSWCGCKLKVEEFRDDIEDGGAAHLQKTVQLMKQERPELLIECLLSDFAGREESIDMMALWVNFIRRFVGGFIAR